MTYDSAPDTRNHIMVVAGYLARVCKKLTERGMVHDASKLEEPEKSMFDEFTPKLQEVEYGSPEYKAATDAMGSALQHHYEHNRHHPQHHDNGVNDMTLLDIIEMVVDWKASSERTGKTFEEFMKTLEYSFERFEIGPQLQGIIKATVWELWGTEALPETVEVPGP